MPNPFYHRSRLTKTQVRKAIARKRSFIANAQASDQRNNPQVVEMVHRSEGELAALEAVLEAMNGGLCGMTILSDGTGGTLI